MSKRNDYKERALNEKLLDMLSLACDIILSCKATKYKTRVEIMNFLENEVNKSDRWMIKEG